MTSTFQQLLFMLNQETDARLLSPKYSQHDDEAYWEVQLDAGTEGTCEPAVRKLLRMQEACLPLPMLRLWLCDIPNAPVTHAVAVASPGDGDWALDTFRGLARKDDLPYTWKKYLELDTGLWKEA